MTGSPPLYATRGQRYGNSTGIFINQAQIIYPDITARSLRGDQQVSGLSVTTSRKGFKPRELNRKNRKWHQMRHFMLVITYLFIGFAHCGFSIGAFSTHIFERGRIFCAISKFKIFYINWKHLVLEQTWSNYSFESVFYVDLLKLMWIVP